MSTSSLGVDWILLEKHRLCPCLHPHPVWWWWWWRGAGVCVCGGLQGRCSECIAQKRFVLVCAMGYVFRRACQTADQTGIGDELRETFGGTIPCTWITARTLRTQFWSNVTGRNATAVTTTTKCLPLSVCYSHITTTTKCLPLSVCYSHITTTTKCLPLSVCYSHNYSTTKCLPLSVCYSLARTRPGWKSWRTGAA